MRRLVPADVPAPDLDGLTTEESGEVLEETVTENGEGMLEGVFLAEKRLSSTCRLMDRTMGGGSRLSL